MKEGICSVDDTPCVWVEETYYDEDGAEIINIICEKCSRLKTWIKR